MATTPTLRTPTLRARTPGAQGNLFGPPPAAPSAPPVPEPLPPLEQPGPPRQMGLRFDGPPTPAGAPLTPGATPAMAPGGSPEAQAFRAQQSAGIGPQQPPPAGTRIPTGMPGQPGLQGLGARGAESAVRGVQALGQMLPDLEGAGARAANAAVQGVKPVAQAISTVARQAGTVAKGNAGTALGAATAFGPHAKFYGDDNVPLGDKLRVGAGDTMQLLGGMGAGAVGFGAGGTLGLLGGPAAPVTVPLGAYGLGALAGAGGAHAGKKLGNALLGTDAALARNHYDPNYGAWDMAKEIVSKDELNGGKLSTASTIKQVPAGGAAGLRGGPQVLPATGAGGGRGFVNPAPALSPDTAPAAEPDTTATAAPANVITRDGNSFSGAPGIREGFSYKDARTGAITTPQQRVTSIPADAMRSADPRLLAQVQAAKLAALERGESIEPAAGGYTSLGGGRGSSAGGGSDVEALARSGALTAAGLDAVVHARGHDIGAESNRYTADVGARTHAAQTAVQDRGNQLAYASSMSGHDAQREGHELQYDSSMRGHDVAAQGHMLSNQVARASARMQQMQQDRAYRLDAEKFGETKAATAFAQRQASAKDLQARFEGTLIDPATGKPDAAQVAEHMAAVNSFHSSAIAAAEAVPKTSPGYDRAQALAAKLRDEGTKAISEDRLQQITLGLKAKQLNAQNAGMVPWKGVHVASSDPKDYQITGIERNTFTPDQYISRNGSKTPVNVYDRRGGTPLVNIGKPRSTEFDPIRGAR